MPTKGNEEDTDLWQAYVFSRFPYLHIKKKRWTDLIRRDNFVPGKFSRLCSRHFVDGEPSVLHPYPELFAYNNYKEVDDQRGKSSILKRETTVTPHSHTNDTDVREAPNIKQTTSRSYLVDGEGNCHTIFLPVSNEVTVETTKNQTSSETMFQMPLHHEYINPIPYRPTFCDSETQTDLSMNDIFELEANIKQMKFDQENLVKTEEKPCLTAEFVDKITSTDKNVSSYLGIPSVMALLGIFAILDKASPSLKYWRGHEGTHHDAKYQLESSTKKPGPSRKLSRYNEFLITLLKIRLALPSFLLGDIFGISESRVSQIFSTWINFMNTVFTPLLKWPNSKKVRKHLPKSFRTTFPKTTCIIDCTEIFIQKPTTPSAQARTYSTYKQHNTYKMLVSITPTGAFNFVSNLWCGNVSDRYITEHSGFLDNIKAGDEVMADRGFLIRDLLLERKATLNIPPFTKKCAQGKGRCLLSRDITKTKKIAKQRIHVERAIGRLKNFKI
ncbi:Hypothetical predicted protein [Mytilus galloprovincialis]|uniref:THAP-type domain-containing protein n=1 Tax=Mytilus galloprovincialis TaxID=29158 RepID=A0A8B6FHM8_MYTGA|nr:Hypothetical predicted protein [Mytilus galloprovincialis]